MEPDFDDDLERSTLDEILETGVPQILEHGSFERLVSALEMVVRGPAFDVLGPELGADEAVLRPVATQYALALWNATPVPANGWRPRRLARPQRNDPCVCGSGRKAKRCCNVVSKASPIPIEMVWPVVAQSLSVEQLKAALRDPDTLPELGYEVFLSELLERQEDDTAYRVLSELFLGERAAELDESLRFPASILLDLARERGEGEEILEALLEKLSPPLRAQAFVSRSLWELQDGDPDATRASLREAERDDPRHPTLGMTHLVTMALTGSGLDEVTVEAERWHRRYRKLGYSPNLEFMERLEDIAADPESWYEQIFLELGGDPEALAELRREWSDEEGLEDIAHDERDEAADDNGGGEAPGS